MPEFFSNIGFSINKVISSILAAIFAFSMQTGLYKPTATPTFEEPEAVEMIEITDDYVIVTSPSATDAEKTAASELQKYLMQISGINFPIVNDSTSNDKEIIVGITNREGTLYTVDRAALGNEGVFIKTVGDDLVLTGGALRGTLYAVYTFLEDYLGCRWYTKELIVVPEAEKIMIPEEIDYTHVPVLEYRETDWISPRDKQWSVANKLNGLVYSPVDSADVGGGMGYAGSFAHTMQTVFNPTVMAANPEIKAIGEETGKPTEEHPCLSHPKTMEIMLNWVYAQLNANPNRQIVSVTHPDNQNYCVCDKCKAVYKEEGSPSGMMLRFVNSIADSVKAKYPGRPVLVDTFAYQYTRQVPAVTKPRDNVIVRLCSIECCFVHALDDPKCDRNVDFIKDLKDWKEICEHLYIWDYTTNYSNFNGPFNNWAVMQPNMKVFTSNNVVGIYEEGNYQARESNGEFGHLRSYILAKLLWDAEVDVNRITIEFCNAYYGDAAPYVLKYLTLATSKAGTTKNLLKEKHMGIFDNVANAPNMDLNQLDISYIDTLWADAKKVETLDEAQLFNVKLSEISWRVWKSTKGTREFSFLTKFVSNQELYNDMKELGITRICEGSEGLMAQAPYFMDPPGRWSEGKVPDFPAGKYY